MFILKNRYKLSDEELIKLISKQQDHRAFEVIYERYHQRVFTYFLRSTQSREIAEDLLQELFSDLWERANQFNPKYPFRPWFYTMGSNLMRKQFRNPVLLDIDGNHLEQESEETPVSLMIEREKMDQIQQISNDLPEHLKEVFWLRIIEEFSVKEVAKIVQIPEGTVKSRLSKAIQLVKEYFETKAKNYERENRTLG